MSEAKRAEIFGHPPRPPRTPRATVDLTEKVEFPDSPEQYRIIRGGVIECGPGDYPRDSQAADAAGLYSFYPQVGFRPARTALPGASVE